MVVLRSEEPLHKHGLLMLVGINRVAEEMVVAKEELVAEEELVAKSDSPSLAQLPEMS